MVERTGLYVPQQSPLVLDQLILLATSRQWLVHEVIWRWTDLIEAMATKEVDLVLTTSLMDLPPDRHPKMVFADDLPPATPGAVRPRWRSR